VLYIFGVATGERIALSDNICTALQLAEHWQDVAEDLGNGRIYLPGEDLERFGCTEADLAARTAGPAVRQLMIFETTVPRACSTRARRWSARCAARPGWRSRATWPAAGRRWPPSGDSTTTCWRGHRGAANRGWRRSWSRRT
jgi:Phytoene/squalene synthetase